MERQEPTFGNDMGEVAFRSESRDRPARRPAARPIDHLAWKIGAAVGVGVLSALLLFNAYERYQARRDAEEALRVLSTEMRKWEREFSAAARTSSPLRPARAASVVKPVPPGYRCAGGVLLHRTGTGWMQITARSNHVYCPHGGTVADCYALTPQSVGCR